MFCRSAAGFGPQSGVMLSAGLHNGEGSSRPGTDEGELARVKEQLANANAQLDALKNR